MFYPARFLSKFLWYSLPCVFNCSVLSDSLQPLDYSPPGASVHEDSPSENTRVGCHALQRIFPAQGLNPGLLHCRQILYHLSTRKSQEYWSTLVLLQGIFLTQELNQGLLHCRWILCQLSYQGSPFSPLLIFNYGLVVALVPLSASDVFYPPISRNMMSKSCLPTAPLGSSDNLGPCLAQTKCLGFSVGTWAWRDRPAEWYKKRAVLLRGSGECEFD